MKPVRLQLLMRKRFIRSGWITLCKKVGSSLFPSSNWERSREELQLCVFDVEPPLKIQEVIWNDEPIAWQTTGFGNAFRFYSMKKFSDLRLGTESIDERGSTGPKSYRCTCISDWNAVRMTARHRSDTKKKNNADSRNKQLHPQALLRLKNSNLLSFRRSMKSLVAWI